MRKAYGIVSCQELQQNLLLQVVVILGVASVSPLAGEPLALGSEYQWVCQIP